MSEIQDLQAAIEAVKRYGTVTEAARQLGIPRRTLGGRYSKAKNTGMVAGMPPLDDEHSAMLDAKFKKVSNEKRVLQSKYNHLLTAFENSERALDATLSFQDNLPAINPIQIQTDKRSKSSESTAVILCSDLHYEETVDPATIDGLNEYSPEIARLRMTRFSNNALKLVDMCRNKSTINKLVFWLGGDFIAGYIHEELMESNAMSPVDAAIEVFTLLVEVIDFILEHGDFEQIILPTNVGNHSRTTKENRISTSVQNNYEWLIYRFLETHYINEPRIKFQLTRGYFNYLDVYGYMLRFHHGNNVRYGGGVGGLTIPLNKAIAMWNQAKPAYLDILGHWHQRLSFKNAVVNGSVIGYNAYAQSIKASFELPQQSFMLMHPRWGKTVEVPIFVE